MLDKVKRIVVMKMSEKKLSLLAVIVLGTIILFEVSFYIGHGRLWPAIFYPTDEVIRPIVVKQSGGSAMLDPVCGDRGYISTEADYIIEGTVEKVESRWNDGGTDIFTYTYLAIENYVKGTPFAETKMTIITPGGCVGDRCQTVEDMPIFHRGKKVRIYFKETNGEFSIVCAQMGVEEIDNSEKEH